MFDASQIKSGMISLVGWRQNENPTGQQLDDMLTSDSGLWFNGQHPLLTIENLLSISPQYDRIYPSWDNAVSYITGDIVLHQGSFYKANTPSAGSEPPDSEWDLYSPFTKWLKQRTEDGIIQAIEMWRDRKFKMRSSKSLLERKQLFTVTGDISKIQTNNGKVVGREIVPIKSLGVILTIQKISVQFDTNQTVELLLFENNKKTPTQTTSIVYTGDGAAQWVDVDWQLSGGKTYWVAYNESVITGNSINGIDDHSHQYNGPQYPMGRYFGTSAFSVDGDVIELWDIDNNVYTTSTNYGINMLIDVRCDYTDIILEQKTLFKSVIAKKVAINLLHELAVNPNSLVNRNELNVDSKMVMYYIHGDTQSTDGNEYGLKSELDNAINSVAFDETGIDKICLPCRKRGVKYRTV